MKALEIVGLVLLITALNFSGVFLAARLTAGGRRPQDRRAAREWEECRAALARNLPPQRNGSPRPR